MVPEIPLCFVNCQSVGLLHILEMGKLSHTEAKELVSGYTAGTEGWPDPDTEPASLLLGSPGSKPE